MQHPLISWCDPNLICLLASVSVHLYDSSLIFAVVFCLFTTLMLVNTVQFIFMGFDLIFQTSPLGASLQPESGEASLDLGELRQVLRDEELAHKLQEEEETLLRRVRDSMTRVTL